MNDEKTHLSSITDYICSDTKTQKQCNLTEAIERTEALKRLN